MLTGSCARPRSEWIAGLGLLLLVGVSLSACKTQAALQRDQLADLARALPGDYDNRGQAQAAPEAEVTVQLKLVALVSVVLGNKAFYLRESVANDPHRVLGQRIWQFTQDKDGRILQQIYLFKEPQRWRSAIDQPEMLLSILEQDLAPLPGCTLVWHKSASGFQAEPDTAVAAAQGAAADATAGKSTAGKGKGGKGTAAKSRGCQLGTQAEGVTIERAIALNGDELTLSEHAADADGRLGDDGTEYRFVRRGGSGSEAAHAAGSAQGSGQ